LEEFEGEFEREEIVDMNSLYENKLFSIISEFTLFIIYYDYKKRKKTKKREGKKKKNP
jgi:hypothetical protein